jgi:hypothetical protein
VDFVQAPGQLRVSSPLTLMRALGWALVASEAGGSVAVVVALPSFSLIFSLFSPSSSLFGLVHGLGRFWRGALYFYSLQ